MVSVGLGCFKAVQGTGILHELRVAGGGAASVTNPKSLALNAILSNLKTAFSGTDHAFDFDKYSHRYLARVQYVFNGRYDLRSLLTRLACVASCTSP